MKKPGLTAALLLGLALLPASRGQAGLACLQDNNHPDVFICPPPGGELIIDKNGDKVCGPGQCVQDSSGRVKCSGEPGGAAVLDSYGNALCVGGCREAAASWCHVLGLGDR